jgi:hypothetical protein
MQNWEKQLACAKACSRCSRPLKNKEGRILSVVDHQPICILCKRVEEKKPDYEDASRQMMAECMEKTGRPYGDTASYCFHHFVPFKCT